MIVELKLLAIGMIEAPQTYHTRCSWYEI